MPSVTLNLKENLSLKGNNIHFVITFCNLFLEHMLIQPISCAKARKLEEGSGKGKIVIYQTVTRSQSSGEAKNETHMSLSRKKKESVV